MSMLTWPAGNVVLETSQAVSVALTLTASAAVLSSFFCEQPASAALATARVSRVAAVERRADMRAPAVRVGGMVGGLAAEVRTAAGKIR